MFTKVRGMVSGGHCVQNTIKNIIIKIPFFITILNAFNCAYLIQKVVIRIELSMLLGCYRNMLILLVQYNFSQCLRETKSLLLMLRSLAFNIILCCCSSSSCNTVVKLTSPCPSWSSLKKFLSVSLM
uniref:Uncharacterized protein n=1 Tax=Cacopsylla melanoneura TaxID=428564 RepID=A0A8D8QIQ6_9HEMI